jgi:hypothetical protein
MLQQRLEFFDLQFLCVHAYTTHETKKGSHPSIHFSKKIALVTSGVTRAIESKSERIVEGSTG